MYIPLLIILHLLTFVASFLALRFGYAGLLITIGIFYILFFAFIKCTFGSSSESSELNNSEPTTPDWFTSKNTNKDNCFSSYRGPKSIEVAMMTPPPCVSATGAACAMEAIGIPDSATSTALSGIATAVDAS